MWESAWVREKTNKVAAVPQAPPKQFTDEELKQQYGIHLATRLQSDEGGNDSKWADIDDEDDWAPEAVEWMDGTKSTVAPQEVASEPQIMQRPAQQKPQAPATRTVLQLAPRTQPQAQEPSAAAPPTEPITAQAEVAKPAPAEPVKPILTPKRADSQSMKILKPGAAASQAKLNGPSAAGADKPSLKAKNPAPPQTSPWKPVPKPDSVSAINPPMQAPPPPVQHAPLASQDARSYEQPQQVPARQIAADTFDRSWQQGEGGARELFNSTNGRYEPAPEGRRSSVKHDNFRKPAVLQRQSHGGPSPAEPSAAFQSRTSAQADGSWGNRRRGSSVSQSSNSAARRMSMQRSQGHDLPTPVPQAGPNTSARLEPTKPTFSQQSAWDQQMPARPASDAQPSPLPAAVPAAEPAPSAEEAEKMQRRVMKEKRELAQKRRKEEEEREAAAKAERLAAKLASLEGAGKSKKERDAEAAAAAANKSAPKVAVADPVPVAQPNPAKPAETSAIVESLEAQTQTLPPPPPPAQSEQKVASQGPQAQVQPASTKQQLPHDIDQVQRQSHAQAPRGGPFQQTNAPYKQSPSSYSSPGGDRQQHLFGRSPNQLNGDSFTPWPTTAPNSNVWGSSGIGNGTFQNSGAFAPLPMVHQGSSLPLPPGMNRTPTSARISPQSFDAESRSPHMQQQHITEQQRAYPPPGIDARPDAFGQPRRNGASSAHGMGNNRPVHPPGPIGPPSRAQNQAHQQQQPRAPPAAGGAWNMVSSQLPVEHDAAAAAARRRELLDAPSQTADTRFAETFKKTIPNQGPLGAPRRYEKTEYSLHDAKGSRTVAELPNEEDMQVPAAPPSAQTQPAAAFSGAKAPHNNRSHQAVESTVRIPNASQNPAHGGQLPPIGRPQGQYVPPQHVNVNYRMAPLAPSIASKEQSPPPPESDGHPVNSGADSVHPHVKLPRPLAKVRLPPTSPSNPQQMPMQNGSVLMPQRPGSGWRPGPPGAARPIVQNEDWQSRFNGLFGRANVQTETPPSPPKTPPKMSLAVASASRAPLYHHTAGATVSLPQAQKSTVNTHLNRSSAISKPAIDQMFYEELSFGSMPKVAVPRNTFYDTSPPPKGMKNLLKMGSNSKAQKQVDAQSLRFNEQLLFPKNHRDGYFVNVPLTRLNKMVPIVGGGQQQQQRNGAPTVGKKAQPPHVAHQERNQERNQERKMRQNNKGTRGGKFNGELGFQVEPVHIGGGEAPRKSGRGGNHNKAPRGVRKQGAANTAAAAPVATAAQSG